MALDNYVLITNSVLFFSLDGLVFIVESSRMKDDCNVVTLRIISIARIMHELLTSRIFLDLLSLHVRLFKGLFYILFSS